VRKSWKAFDFFLRLCLLRLFWPVLYTLGRLRPLNPRLLLFASESSEAVPDNLVPVMEQLVREGFDCRYFGRRKEAKWRRYLRTCRFFFDYARARAIFVDDTFSPILGCRPRKQTAVVQLWHACGAFKKWGYSTLDLRWGVNRRELRFLPIHRYYTHVSVSSPAVIPFYAEAFACAEDIIHPWGAPRTDFYFQPDITARSRQAVLAVFPAIGARKMILYAPTFRGDTPGEARHDVRLDIAAMAEALGGDCVLLQKPHPKVESALPAPETAALPFAFDARALPIETLLCAADLVITDYSSLIFEYALLCRPMLFYPYDLEDYEAARSFFIPYLEFVPGDLVWDTQDVIAGIGRNLLAGGFDAERVRRFALRYMSACDGGSTRRIIEQVLGCV
jgi:CDP-ribitol ribitolphosphotransferase